MTAELPHTERQLWAIAIRVCTRKELDAAALIWLEHKTYDQAALLLGITRGSLHSRLRSARRRIADHAERTAA